VAEEIQENQEQEQQVLTESDMLEPKVIMPSQIKLEKPNNKFDVHSILQKARITKDDQEVAIATAEESQESSLLESAAEIVNTEGAGVASSSFESAASIG